jgi:hypothetical protein
MLYAQFQPNPSWKGLSLITTYVINIYLTGIAQMGGQVFVPLEESSSTSADLRF